MRNNEAAALASIAQTLALASRNVTKHGGVVRNARGDGLFATFRSAQDAVRAALDVHKRTAAEGVCAAQLRAAVHIGEIFRVGGQLLGDSVNVAARIEALSKPGSVLVSRPVYEALRGHSELIFTSIGSPPLRNIGSDLELFRVEEELGRCNGAGYELQLMGGFALVAPQGAKVAVDQDGQALLAALALAPGGALSRQWLANTIWDFCIADERAARLDATLSLLAEAFGDDAPSLLDADEDAVRLVQGGLLCDAVRARRDGWQSSGTPPDLLEGCGFESETFRGWLLRERSIFRNEICLKAAERFDLSRASYGTSLITSATPVSTVFAIGLLPPLVEGMDVKARMMADVLADWLVKSLSEFAAVEIHDYRDGSGRSLTGPNAPQLAGPDLLIQCRAATADTMVQIAITALRAEDRKLIWSQCVAADQGEFMGLAGPSVASFVSYATDALLSALASGRYVDDPAAHRAAKTAVGAVHRLLTMTGPGLDRVEADLLAAYDADPKPIYLAWLAYMTTFRVGERYGLRDATLEEQAKTMARLALEAAPHNSLVLGLVAHVHSYIFREFAFADDLISRAVETNPFCSLSWDSASLLYAYTGRTGESMNAALNARRLGRHSPYRHLFDGACCVAAAVNGNFDDAVSYGESVIAVQPHFKAVLRYLAASYGHLGDSERAREIMGRLMHLEPDLSVERLRDRSYPVPSRQSALLIESGLSRVGLRKTP